MQAQVSQISIQRIFHKSHVEIVWKSRMEIAYANRVWKSYTGASFGNFDSADPVEIAHGNVRMAFSSEASSFFSNWIFQMFFYDDGSKGPSNSIVNSLFKVKRQAFFFFANRRWESQLAEAPPGDAAPSSRMGPHGKYWKSTLHWSAA